MLFKSSCARPLAAGLMVTGLLAGTALVGFSPGAEAAKIGTELNPAAMPAPTSVANTTVLLKPNTVSAQLFGGRTPGDLVLGTTGDVGTGTTYIVLLNRPLNDGDEYGLQIDVSGAQFARVMSSVDVQVHSLVDGDPTATPPTVDTINPTATDTCGTGEGVSVRDTRVRITGCTAGTDDVWAIRAFPCLNESRGIHTPSIL